MNTHDFRLSHIKIGVPAPASYKAPKSRTSLDLPDRDRKQHADRLRKQLKDLEASIEHLHEDRKEQGYQDVEGVLVTVWGTKDHDLAGRNLNDKRQNVEVVNVGETQQNQKYAVVRMGRGEVRSLSHKVEQYEKVNTKTGKPRYNDVVRGIQEIKRSLLIDLWTGPIEQLPKRNGEDHWWEVWLIGGSESSDLAEYGRLTLALFAKNEQIDLDLNQRIEFAERQVFLLKAKHETVEKAIEFLDSIIEVAPPSRGLRDLYVHENTSRQEFQSAADRLTPPNSDSPAITLLDTGVNDAHPLLRPAIDLNGLHTVDPTTPETGDYQGHGTEMAGIALYDDLSRHVLSEATYHFPAHLESVRIRLASSDEERHLWGKVTWDAVMTAESVRSERNRIFCMAISGEPITFGKPSSWSSTLDKLTYNKGQASRLFAVAAGNVPLDTIDLDGYPSRNLSTQLDDPAQAKNVLTVGAMTDFCEVSRPTHGDDVVPIAGQGQISPHTTSHMVLNDAIKPDVVCEGGNVGWADPLADGGLEGLALITTHKDFLKSPFTVTWATSPATATASRIMARIWNTNPNFKPETIRGLLVHSASWTQGMQQQFPDKHDLLRTCGYGLPNEELACRSATSAVTLIAEGTIRTAYRERIPGRRRDKWSEWKRDILIFDLPWPEDVLLDLGDKQIELRVTLSYFCDPNPAHKLRAYQGAGLQWELKKTDETRKQFVKRVNAAQREDGDSSFEGSRDWQIGKQARSRGTVQSDRWHGTAAELASRSSLAVYPVKGWWFSDLTKHPFQEVQFSLIVSILAEDVTIDVYNPIMLTVSASIET